MNNVARGRKSFTVRKSQGEIEDVPNCAGFRPMRHLLQLEKILISCVTDALKNDMFPLLVKQKLIAKPEDYKMEEHLRKIKRKISINMDLINVWI